MRKLILLLVPALLIAGSAYADEGMWSFDNPPVELIKRKYGVELTPAWLEHVRLSTVRLSNCTASFVSPNGLLLTNFHCSWACLDQHSTPGTSLLQQGYLARGREQELRCETQVADVLVGYEDITARVTAATQGLDDKAANDARRKTLAALEHACEQESRSERTGPLKCESVNLYGGGQYWLYKYKRYDDVRLVFAPESGIAQFGGDPDNFQFPRWCLDMSVLRVYDAGGKPASTPNFLKIDFDGPAVNEPVFVAGHPGSTDRLLTVAQLESLRNIDLPHALLRRSELRGRYIQFAKTSPAAARMVQAPLSALENAIKVQRKQLDALHVDALLARKAREERAIRRKLEKTNPELAQALGDPWADIEKAEERWRALELPYTYLERGAGFDSSLFRMARTLVRGAAERARPDGERLREYRETALPRIEQRLSANVPIHPELEQLTLSFSLERMREWLGPDDPTVRQLLGKESPDQLAERLVNGSKLADASLRMALWNGGAQAVDASDDPMIVLARRVDARARAVRKRYEDEVQAVVRVASEKIAKARFAALGTSVYPDATFTLRLSYGAVQGWVENGTPVQPFTRLARLFERATGEAPFAVPESWLKVKDRLDPQTKFNLTTNNDIVGGNSGSPLIDARGDIVGLIFDGNIHSISGAYWFDEAQNRAVAVHPAIIREALTKVYGAKELLAELQRASLRQSRSAAVVRR